MPETLFLTVLSLSLMCVWFLMWVFKASAHLSKHLYFFRTTPAAYGGSQARGWIRATAAGLCHSSWQRCIFNPLSKARDRTCVLLVPGQIHFHWAMMGTPQQAFTACFSCAYLWCGRTLTVSRMASQWTYAQGDHWFHIPTAGVSISVCPP